MSYVVSALRTNILYQCFVFVLKKLLINFSKERIVHMTEKLIYFNKGVNYIHVNTVVYVEEKKYVSQDFFFSDFF